MVKKVIIATVLLAVSIVSVQLIYAGFITPDAERLVSQSRAAGTAAPQVFSVILKDGEQQACVTLALWCLLLMAGKFWGLWNESHLDKIDYVGLISEENSLGDEKDTLRKTMAEFEKLPEKFTSSPVVQTLLSSIRRYLMTDDVHSTSEAISLSIDALAMRQESENTMIRYVIWAIPSIGFIGTVRGIGAALSQADEALAGDITLMTDSLGVAFNSTLVALVLSIFLMLMLHILQGLQDGQLIKTQAYCEKFLLNRISK
ncbi:MotA/TolQ/ExbB proton channel family protein [uncultured Sneathiella sp.]|jgi:biopolymer transport protein ExbB/TolQ|uniref:MotA/TolQ/ExbB proton channel family protein n=1 Tax=uncultured Sneathiella sp. TaxID=879315 RepID=UPI0030D84483|tara:strand:- start:15888 stop:16664 length:777 start_codon:yes stop_codon:yes gene_type:complete